jgi:hypothetical protein
MFGGRGDGEVDRGVGEEVREGCGCVRSIKRGRPRQRHRYKKKQISINEVLTALCSSIFIGLKRVQNHLSQLTSTYTDN